MSPWEWLVFGVVGMTAVLWAALTLADLMRVERDAERARGD